VLSNTIVTNILLIFVVSLTLQTRRYQRNQIVWARVEIIGMLSLAMISSATHFTTVS